MTQLRTEGQADLFPAIERRTFLKMAGATAAVAAGAGLFAAGTRKTWAQTIPALPGDPLDSDASVKVLYTVCQMCHARCGLKAKVLNGVLIKTDGNPYNPTNAEWGDGTHAARPAYATDPALAATKARRGRICAKAQTIPEMVYNPTRLTAPLKRVGRRGEGKWVAMSWDDAIKEIVNGATLPGSTAPFRGLKAIYNDTADISSLDPALGKKRNGVCFSPGRFPHGNKEFGDWLFKDVYGTVNGRHDHTSICETSHHVAFNKQTSESRAFSQGGKSGLGPDFYNSEFCVLWGENPAEASFPHQAFARLVADAMHRATNPMVLWVVDPRLSRTAALAKKNNGKWLGVKPGADAALAMGVIRELIRLAGHNTAYLENANRKAAKDNGELSFTDASYLVRRDNGELLNAKDVNAAWTDKNYVCVQKGTTSTAVEVDPDNGTTAVEGVIDVDGLSVALAAGGSVTCDSAFHLLKAEAEGRTLAQWAATCGIAEADITELATKIKAAGRKAAISHYRGPVQHVNGTVTSMAINSINWLIGNTDRKGGVGKDDHWHEFGEGKTGTKYNLKSGELNDTVNAKPTKTGPQITRVGNNCADFNTFFTSASGPDKGAYPTKRPWFKWAQNGNFQELIPSIGDQYPYAIEVLISLWNAWPYSTPGGNHGLDILKDTTKIPLHVAIDVQLGELSALADYVLPDATFAEIVATPHGASTIRAKYSGLRYPVVGEFWDAANGKYVPVAEWAGQIAQKVEASRRATTNASTPAWGTRPYYRPAVPNARTSYDILLQLFAGTNGLNPDNDASTASHLPGVGANAFKKAFDAANTADDKHLWTAWDWFKRLASNIAHEDNPSFVVSGDELATIDYVLARGGRFEDGPDNPAAGDFMKHTFGKSGTEVLIHLYVEDFAKTVNPMTGKKWAEDKAKGFSPLGTYVAPADALGNSLADAGYELQLITYKLSWHGQGRTVVNATLMSIWPENEVVMNAADAATRNIHSGDLVRLTSVSNPMGVTGRAHVTYGIAQGVVAVSHHFGHWELASRPHVINGQVSWFDRRRAAGLSPNPIMRVDHALNNKTNAATAKVAVQDLIGGSVSFSDTWIKVEKV